MKETGNRPPLEIKSNANALISSHAPSYFRLYRFILTRLIESNRSFLLSTFPRIHTLSCFSSHRSSFPFPILSPLTPLLDKAPWINHERNRWAQIFRIPLAPKGPSPFPIRTVDVQRALTAITLIAPEKLGDAIAALYEQFFVKLGPVAKAEDFLPILRGVLGGETGGKVEGLVSVLSFWSAWRRVKQSGRG